jgi:hypothetical protein
LICFVTWQQSNIKMDPGFRRDDEHAALTSFFRHPSVPLPACTDPPLKPPPRTRC